MPICRGCAAAGCPTIDPNPNNIITCGPAGLLAISGGGGCECFVTVLDTQCIDMSITGTGASGSPFTISAVPVIDPDPSNTLTCGPAGLLALGGGGGGFGFKDFERIKRTAGSLILNSTIWADLPSLGDIVLSAAAGDTVEVGLNGLWNNEPVVAFLDAATIVAGSPVSYLGDDGSAASQGAPGWRGDNVTSNPTLSGSITYTLTPADISAGTVTLRIRYRTNTATNKTLFAETDIPLQFWATNHGVPTGDGCECSEVAYGKVATSESTVSGVFVDLTTPGPSATVTVPASGAVEVTLSSRINASGGGGGANLAEGWMGVELSGANTVVANQSDALAQAGNANNQASYVFVLTGLTPGLTTFTAKYRIDNAATATFANRHIIVKTLP